MAFRLFSTVAVAQSVNVHGGDVEMDSGSRIESESSFGQGFLSTFRSDTHGFMVRENTKLTIFNFNNSKIHKIFKGCNKKPQRL